MKIINVKENSKVFLGTIYFAQIPEGYYLSLEKEQIEISEEEFNDTKKKFISNMILGNIEYKLYENFD